MIYRKLIVTNQNYEVSSHDKTKKHFIRLSCPAQTGNRRVKLFAVAGYHAVVCDAFIQLYFYL